MERIYQYPLLRITEEDSDSEQLHKVLIALRELWNTRNTLDLTLPWGQLDGCRFGLEAIVSLLAQPGVPKHSKCDRDEVSHKIHDAMQSDEPSKNMAEFVRWATRTYMDFLDFMDSNDKILHRAAQSGLSKLGDVKNRLLANTFEVDRTIHLDGLAPGVHGQTYYLLDILRVLFGAIVNHHKYDPDSRIGVDEILLIAEETDFVMRNTNNYMTLHSMFAMHEIHELQMWHRLEGISIAIGKQLQKRPDPIAIEYAIRTVVHLIPQLHFVIVQSLPLVDLTDRFEWVALEQIGQQLRADISARLAPTQLIRQTPEAQVTPSVYNTVRTRQPRSVQSIATSAVSKKLEGPFGEEDERSVGSHHSSLFGSQHDVLNEPPAALSRNDRERPLRLALPPASSPRKMAKLGKGASKNTLSLLPPGKAPRHYTVSEPGHRAKALQANSFDSDWGRHLTNNLLRARTPSGITPAASKNSVLHTGQSNSATNHAKKRGYNMSGSNERAAETMVRLRGSKMPQKKANKPSVLRPMGRIDEEPADSSRASQDSEVDDDGDSRMGGDGDDDDEDDQFSGEEGSEESDEE